MKRIAQIGLAGFAAWAAPVWSQESPFHDPVVIADADTLPRNSESSPALVDIQIRQLRMAVSSKSDDDRSEMIEVSSQPMGTIPSNEQIQQLRSERCYVSEVGSATNSCCFDAPCHSTDCHYCSAEQTGRLARFKACMQRTHWGYCNYFDEPGLGESTYSTLSMQIQRGVDSSMMLYQYDFYPEGSARESELTPRGLVQLMKIIDLTQVSAAPIQIQIDESRPTLNKERRQHVVESLITMGASVPDQHVVLARIRHKGSAIEANQVFENQLQSVISRGRSIQVEESARFGGR